MNDKQAKTRGRNRIRHSVRAKWRTRLLRSEAAFSLIEMMVATGLATILSFMAVPTVSELFRTYQLAGATNQLAADLARARIQAVAQHRFVRVRFVDSNGYVLERSTNGVNFAQDGTVIRLPSTVTSASGDTPTFRSSGLATAIAYMTITNGMKSKTVRINPVGRVEIL